MCDKYEFHRIGHIYNEVLDYLLWIKKVLVHLEDKPDEFWQLNAMLYAIVGENNIESCRISVSCIPIPSQIFLNAADARTAAEVDIINGNIEVALIVFPQQISGLPNSMATSESGEDLILVVLQRTDDSKNGFPTDSFTNRIQDISKGCRKSIYKRGENFIALEQINVENGTPNKTHGMQKDLENNVRDWILTLYRKFKGKNVKSSQMELPSNLLFQPGHFLPDQENSKHFQLDPLISKSFQEFAFNLHAGAEHGLHIFQSLIGLKKETILIPRYPISSLAEFFLIYLQREKGEFYPTLTADGVINIQNKVLSLALTRTVGRKNLKLNDLSKNCILVSFGSNADSSRVLYFKVCDSWSCELKLSSITLSKQVLDELVGEFGKMLGSLITNYNEKHNTLTFPNFFTFRQILGPRLGKPNVQPITYSNIPTLFLRNDSPIEWIGKANSLQECFIAHYLSRELGDSSHAVQCVWVYNTDLDVEKFEAAWRLVYATYPGLRVKFDWSEASNLFQIVDKGEALEWRFLDWTTLELSIHQHHLIELQMKDKEEYFDLASGHLIRITLVRLGPTKFFSMISFHRIILDEWSLRICLSAVHNHYFSAVEKVEFRDHVVDINCNPAELAFYRAQAEMEFLSESHTQHLLKVLPSCISEPNFTSLTTLPVQSLNLSNLVESKIVFDNVPEKNVRLLSTLLKFTWHRTLRIFLQLEQTVVATTVSCRSLISPGIDGCVGQFMNTLPMVVDHRELDKLNLLQGLHLVQDGLVELNAKSAAKLRCLIFQYGGCPFYSIFTFQDSAQLGGGINWEEKLGVESQIVTEKINIPMVLSARVLNNRLYVTFLMSDSFSSEAVESLTKSFQFQFNYVIERLSLGPEILQCSQIQYRPPPNSIFNPQTSSRAKRTTILERFLDVHRRFPNGIAQISENRKLTYDDLHQLSNNLAATIVKVGKENVGPEKFVALMLEQGEWTVIGILGVLKTGSAYVPIDSKFPEARTRHILVDCGAQVLITDKLNHGRKSGLALNEIFIEDECNCACSEVPTVTLPLIAENNLAYLMYTSGTSATGPKGVLVEHKSVINLIDSLAPKYFSKSLDEKGQEVVLQLSNYAFDASVVQLWTALLNGHVLLVPTHLLILNLTEFTKFLTTFGVTHVVGTPSFLKLIHWSQVPTLRRLVVAAETFTVDAWTTLTKTKPHFRIIQEYGPTEATVCSSHFEMREHSKSIGFPIDGTTFYVIDEHLNLLPDHAVGELCIGGICLARGYLDPKLTTNKFIVDHFQTNSSQRLYRSGDLVRRKSDGDFEFIGRNDFQVKIRGHRVELDEVEQKLRGFDQVVEAIVVAKPLVEGGEMSLIAYYVGGGLVNTVTLRKWLLERLPSYAVPSSFTRIEAVPLTNSGKIDLKALPAPTIIDRVEQSELKSSIELEIINLWSQILRIDPEFIGLDEDFFALGGDSLLLMRMLDKVHQLSNVRIRVQDIYSEKTVRKLVQAVETVPRTMDDQQWANKTKYTFNDFPDFNLYEEIEGIGERIFLFPPAEGGINTYMENLVPLLRPRPIFLFNSLFNYTKRRFGQGIQFEEAAEMYVPEIRNIQAVGPYHLVGWSWGGVLAFEIARQMADGNSDFGNVYILDSCFALDKAITLQDDRDYFSSIDDVSYNYHPKLNCAMNSVKFTFFKCTLVRRNGPEPSAEDLINHRIYSFYVYNTTANYLDTIIPEGCSLEIIPINANHLEWFRDAATVNLIAITILNSNSAADTITEPWQENLESGITVRPFDPEMMSTRHSSQFLKLIVEISKAERVLEIGMFTGYTAAIFCSAECVKKVTTLDMDPFIVNFVKSRFAGKVEEKKLCILGGVDRCFVVLHHYK